MAQGKWRRGWDSNPRLGFTPNNGLANPSAETVNPFDVARNADVSAIETPRRGRYSREMLGLTKAHESAQRKVKPIEVLLSRFTVAASGCHEWTGSTNGKGYGVMLLGGGSKDKKVLLLAHRLQWMHHHGPLAKGAIVMHHCDNRLCIRIDHLQAGSQLQNMRDMIDKGRHNYLGLKHSGPSAQNQAHRRKP